MYPNIYQPDDGQENTEQLSLYDFSTLYSDDDYISL